MLPKLPAVIALAAATFTAPSLSQAQHVRVMPGTMLERRLDDRPMIGISTAVSGSRADTLGLRIESVTKGSPAEKAGLKEGDRLQSVNGVSLRADRADAGEDETAGLLTRRLQREVQKVKAGEGVELRVLSDGQARTVRVVPVEAKALEQDETGAMWRSARGDRAVVGMTVMSTGTARDTIGVFVQAVTEGGPAEKAGIVEGDRIAAINGLSVRVAREDVEDDAIGAARADRLVREIGKLKAGESAELTVVSGGRSRSVRVTAVAANTLPGGDGYSYFFRTPDGASQGGVFLNAPGGTLEFPRFQWSTPSGGSAADRAEVEQRLEELLRRMPALRGELREKTGEPLRERIRIVPDPTAPRGRVIRTIRHTDVDV